jgi:hypothetical protein
MYYQRKNELMYWHKSNSKQQQLCSPSNLASVAFCDNLHAGRSSRLLAGPGQGGGEQQQQR